VIRAKGHSKCEFADLRTEAGRAGWLSFATLAILLCTAARGQTSAMEIPAATPLSVQLLRHVPMKKGEPLVAQLLYPVYVDNRIAIPAGTTVHGRVVKLNANRSHRIHSRLRGDFTPFHIPVVRFDEIVLPNGEIKPISSGNATNGAPVLRLSPPPGTKKGSLISREIDDAKQRVKDAAAQITAPGRGDRLVQFLYTQLPYHPERIESGTGWLVELTQPLTVPEVPTVQVAAWKRSAPANVDGAEPAAPEWRLHAYLQQTISSGTAKAGDKFQATISEPVFNEEHAVVVPQGATLTGEITRSKPARSFGRQGKLRFRFRELKLPSGFSQPVEGTLSGVDSDRSTNLQMDSEGGLQPRPQNRVILPLVLTLLATHALDDDGNLTAQTTFGSNGFGIVGRVVGIAAGSRNVAAGIGLYGASLAIYDLWLAPGKNVTFIKNTRIEVTTTPGRNPISAPSPDRPAPGSP
jgi:hypothetical protein